jgi:hypothetical protein
VGPRCASISADAIINGKLSFNTPTRISKLKGELRCRLLIIGATAVVRSC